MWKAGDRVELVFCDDEFTTLKAGDQGTVTRVSHVTSGEKFTQVNVNWDNGSTLIMVPEAGDRIRTIG